ncbi:MULTISPECIES: hypothetical protein [unclassified Streptomyces]|nr:hypothetical protein [Streptomyces sp. NBC_01750]WSB02879.1 hypothetical protein OIE54_28585 [Streptomyces sp. NBC_01794]WSD32848.1 hypothetical protein OG966_13540 [Streptomyces sp. NBC_01750]
MAQGTEVEGRAEEDAEPGPDDLAALEALPAYGPDLVGATA